MTPLSHDAELLTRRNRPFALSKSRGDHSQVAIDGDEAIVLHQDFEAAGTLLLETDHLAGCRRQYRCACRCR